MKKVFITGGTGTVGKSFIKQYYDEYEFYTISRNEMLISNLQHEFPKVTSYVGNISDMEYLINLFEKIKPDIVIHAAALKHVNLAEENPSSAIEININGTLNVIKASIRAEVPLTIGVSSDKASKADNVYGYTKYLMECLFHQHHSPKTKFICTRFANVANSNGSVIPYWVSENLKGNSLKITDVNMNRLMFSMKESSELIRKSIEYVESGEEKPFTLACLMKNVNLYSLAKVISDKEVIVIGKRPGEKLNETLISEKELKNTKVDKNYVLIYNQNTIENNLKEEYSSLTAPIMDNKEMINLISSS